MSGDRTHYESHAWNPTEDDQECIVCGVTWGECESACPQYATGGLIDADALRRAFALIASQPCRPCTPLLSPRCGLEGQHDACRSAICECGCHVRDPFWDHVCGCTAWADGICTCAEAAP